MKRVLVTGASGFVGRHALRHLVERGFEVHAVDRNVANLLDELAQKRLVESVRPTHLLHLAWDVTPGKYWTSLSNVDWLRASLNLCRIFAASGGRRWVGVGTCAEYDWSCGPVFCEDKTPLKPASLYGASKLSLCLMQEHIARELGVSFAWSRLFYLYGPYEAQGRFVTSLVSSLGVGQPAICRHDHLIRDMLHVDDAARAVVEVLDSNLSGAVNIGSGEPVRLGTVAELIASACGHTESLELGLGRFPLNDPVEITADVSKLRSMGFEVRFSLADGLRQTVEWWRLQRTPFRSAKPQA